MNDKQILEGSPESSITHFDGNHFWQFTNDHGWCRYCNPIAKLVAGEPSSKVQALSDIKRIVELEKDNTELREILNGKNNDIDMLTGVLSDVYQSGVNLGECEGSVRTALVNHNYQPNKVNGDSDE